MIINKINLNQMEFERLKDSLLKTLQSGPKSIIDFESFSSAIDVDDIASAIQDLLVRGYIETIAANNGGTFELLKPGRKFIEKTSFEEQKLIDNEYQEKKWDAKKLKEDREDMEFNWKAKDVKRNNTNTFLTVLLVLFAGWNIYSARSTMETINKSTARIDSISDMVSLSRLKIDSLSKITKANNTKNESEKTDIKVNKAAETSIIK